TLRLTFALAVVTAGLLVVGFLQWQTYEAQLLANYAVQRPFINANEFRLGMHYDSLPDGRPPNISYSITPILENGGTTPTVNARLVVQYNLRDVLIGPRGRMHAATGIISAGDLSGVIH